MGALVLRLQLASPLILQKNKNYKAGLMREKSRSKKTKHKMEKTEKNVEKLFSQRGYMKILQLQL